jgi:hypothetical protein
MTPEHTKQIDVFVSSIKPQSNCIFIFDTKFSFFLSELQMAKSHFARWHLTNKYKTFARGTLRELILIGEPSGNTGGNPRGTHPHPRGTLGEPIPVKPRGTVGVPKSQISIQLSNLISKMYESHCFFPTICNIPVRCHLHSCLLHIYLSQICLNPKLPKSDCYEDIETHHTDVRLFVSIKPLPNCF